MRLLFMLVVSALLLATPAHATPTPPRVMSGPVVADVLSVYDGDTLTVLAYPWPGINTHVSVRLLGVDTPEIRGKCDLERTLAQQAREVALAALGTRVTLTNIRHDKYAGRVLADITLADGRSLADVLIASGLARPYDGGARQSWCPAPSQE
jgi:endonuclease YncB( thermonuclease family)